jgi:thioredoxin 1
MMEKIGQSELEEKLLSSPFVILDFTSPGCAPCKKIAQDLPGLLAGLQPAAIAAYEVDITTDAPIAARFFVLGVPALILFKQGKEIGRYSNLPKIDTIKRLLS